MYAPPEVYSEDWDLQALIAYAEEFYAPADLLQIDYLQNLSREELEEYLHKLPMNITLNARMLLHLKLCANWKSCNA